MGTKTCDRDQISVLKQTLKQLPAQIPKQIPKQKLLIQIPKQISKKRNKVILIEKPPVPICFGYKPTPEEDECGICRHCRFNQDYNQEKNILSCNAKTALNKARQTKSKFQKTQKKVLNQRIDEVFDSLKNL